MCASSLNTHHNQLMLTLKNSFIQQLWQPWRCNWQHIISKKGCIWNDSLHFRTKCNNQMVVIDTVLNSPALLSPHFMAIELIMIMMLRLLSGMYERCSGTVECSMWWRTAWDCDSSPKPQQLVLLLWIYAPCGKLSLPSCQWGATSFTTVDEINFKWQAIDVQQCEQTHTLGNKHASLST